MIIWYFKIKSKQRDRKIKLYFFVLTSNIKLYTPKILQSFSQVFSFLFTRDPFDHVTSMFNYLSRGRVRPIREAIKERYLALLAR